MKRVEIYRSFFCIGRRRFFFCLLSFFFLHFCTGENLFNFAELKFTSTLTLPREESKKEKAVSGSTGLKLSFRDADLRGYATLPKTSFSELREAEGFKEKADLLKDFRYGAGIFLFQKTFPLTIKAGSNTYSKSLSKLKNPSPSTTGNPLTKSFAFSTGLGASLPTLTSSVQALSACASIKIPEKSFFIPLELEFFMSEEKVSATSACAKFSFNRFVFLQQAFSLGRFFIENDSAILKKNNADFKGDWFFSLLSETAFHSPVLKLHFYSGFQQSPYASDSLWLKLDGRTSFKSFLLDFSYFFVPTSKNQPKVAPLIGGSSSISRIIEQGSVNPQLIFLFDDKNASSLRFGFSALENWKVTSTSTPVQLNTLKLRGAVSFENRFFSLRFDFTNANILLQGSPPTKSSRPENCQTYSFSSSFSRESYKASISSSYSKYPPYDEDSVLKETLSLSTRFAFPKLNLSLQTGGDLTLKEGENYASSLNAALSYSIKKKYFRSSFKFALDFPIL